jgi:hypothetical protein
MSPDSDKPNPPPTDDKDLGEPIADLLNLEQDTSPTFLSVVRRKIYRRSTTAQFVSFSFDLPKIILVEFWNMIVQLLSHRSTQKGGRS